MKLQTLLVIAAIAMGVAQARAADTAAGEALYGTTCKNCHGPTAKGMSSYPKLRGKDAEHVSMRLVQYRAGEKVGPNSPLMIPMAADLTDEDIANLAAFLASLP